jgi:Tol biopolymer transport system component
MEAMAGDTLRPAASSNGLADNGRLDSWKEIAAYLRRDVTTVRRWEKREGLPVHRHLHERRDSVYAFAAEIEEWWQSRRSSLAQNGAAEGGPMANAAHPSEADEPPNAPAPNEMRAGWAWALAATFLVTTIVLGVLVLTQTGDADDARAVERRLPVLPPAGTSFVDFVVSPDGRYYAFTAAPNDAVPGRTKLWVQPADSLQARALPDTDGASFPFWSPTSDALGFFTEGHLWTVDVAGGSPRSIAVAPGGRGGTWNRKGVIVFAPERRGGLSQVPSSGGGATPVTRLTQGIESAHAWPSFLPDDIHFLYVAHGGRPTDDHQVFVGALEGSERRHILTTNSGVLYSADGYVYYQRERKLFAQPFDVQRLDVTGTPIELAGEVLEHHAFPAKTEFSVSSNGILTYQAPQRSATRLIWRDRTGRSSALIDTPADHQDPTLSPDETRVAYDVFDLESSERFGVGLKGVTGHILLLDRTTGQTSRLTSHPATEWGAVWSRDGKSIVYSRKRQNQTLPPDELKMELDLFVKDMTDPTSVEVQLNATGVNPVAHSWSPDGRFVVYSTFDPKAWMDLWLLPMLGDRTPIKLLGTEAAETQGRISPDGRWLAYTSTESGQFEVWVTTFPTPTTKWRISSGGAGDPRWGRDGRELYFVADDRQLMAVAVTTSKTTFEHGTPTSLFDLGVPPHWYEARNLYDVSRDGRFLVMAPVEDDRSAPVTVVLNWAARLRKSLRGSGQITQK